MTAHPLGLKTDHIAGDILAAEVEAVVEHFTGVCLLVENAGIAVCELRHHYGVTCDLTVKGKDVLKVVRLRNVEVEVYLAFMSGDGDSIGISLTAVICGGVCAVKEHTPAVCGHNEGHRTVGSDVSDVDTGERTAACDIFSGFVPETEDSFLFCHCEIDGESLIAVGLAFEAVKCDLNRLLCTLYDNAVFDDLNGSVAQAYGIAVYLCVNLSAFTKDVVLREKAFVEFALSHTNSEEALFNGANLEVRICKIKVIHRCCAVSRPPYRFLIN